MIRSFRDSATERVFYLEDDGHWAAEIARAARRKLRMLDAAARLDDLRTPPGNRLEKLRGSRLGQWSIRVNARWRICFLWRDDGVFDVQLVDYH